MSWRWWEFYERNRLLIYYLEKWIDNIWDEDEEFSEETENYRELQNDIPTAEQISLGKFAVRQYKAYKLAAGKTAKSILISCSTRLAPFSIDKVLEITQYDEMHLDKIGDELTALLLLFQILTKHSIFLLQWCTLKCSICFAQKQTTIQMVQVSWNTMYDVCSMNLQILVKFRTLTS